MLPTVCLFMYYLVFFYLSFNVHLTQFCQKKRSFLQFDQILSQEKYSFYLIHHTGRGQFKCTALWDTAFCAVRSVLYILYAIKKLS